MLLHAKMLKVRKFSISRQGRGFTLIELLVVMAILGLLASVGIGNFRSAQIKARDAQRKHDLEQLRRALEMYFNDKGQYPAGLPSAGEEWRDTEVADGTLYMRSIPDDPGAYSYLYENAGSSVYKLFARLENQRDSDVQECIVSLGKNCGSTCNYGVSSANLGICD